MKKLSRFLALLFVLCTCFALFVACEDPDPCKDGHTWENGKCTVCDKPQCDVDGHKWVNGVCTVCQAQYQYVDYVDQLKLDMNSATAKYTSAGILYQYVDGDTTHFNVPTSIDSEGTLKARYLAVNTPESTGKVEPYGKVASDFTHETLQSALDNGGSILLESDTDDGKWNHDSYGRMLSWVWYKPNATADYRNLNVELLQKGYALGSNSGDNRYGDVCINALNQAVEAKLIVHSGLPDENYYYGDAIEMDLKQLRANLESYEGKRVAFDGVVTLISGGGSYVEDLDGETGMAFGIFVYYGTEKNAKILEIMGTPGNRVRVVGVLSNYNGTWQVSDIKYRMSKPNDPGNVKLISAGNSAYYQKLTVPEFFGVKKIKVFSEVEQKEIEKTIKVYDLVLNTTVAMDDLTVYDTSTTANGGSNDGAFTLYCKDSNGNKITVRTAVLYKNVNGTDVKVLASEFMGKTISVKGIVEYFSLAKQYQVKVLNYADIVVE